MKKVFTQAFVMAALLVAGAAFVSCDKESAHGVYTMTVNATMADNGAKQLGLSADGHTLTASWATTENVYVKKGASWATGSLQPQNDGVSTILDGTLSGIEINPNDELTLQFPRSGEISYDGQVGTLADIAANFDYATATVTVASVNNGQITTTADAAFTNQQAIVKFTLTDNASTPAALNATQLVVTVGTTSYTITPAEGTSVMYVALPGFSNQTVTLTATVGSSTYTYEKSDATFANGQYYEITVKMAPASAATVTTATELTQEYVTSHWSEYDSNPLTASDLLDFQAVTLEQAQAWTGAPTGGNATILIYGFEDGCAQWAWFTDEGTYDCSGQSAWEHSDIFWNVESINYYYTTQPSN